MIAERSGALVAELGKTKTRSSAPLPFTCLLYTSDAADE